MSVDVFETLTTMLPATQMNCPLDIEVVKLRQRAAALGLLSQDDADKLNELIIRAANNLERQKNMNDEIIRLMLP